MIGARARAKANKEGLSLWFCVLWKGAAVRAACISAEIGVSSS